jgi:uncharacterized membrane protein
MSFLTFFKLFGIGFITTIILDAVWLGFFMNSFYKASFGTLGRLDASGNWAPVWTSALIVYAIIALGIVFFVLPGTTSLTGALLKGALFGFVVYGVYDFTNHAILQNYSLSLVFVDLFWGMCVGAINTALLFLFSR